MGQDIEEGRLEIGGVLFIMDELVFVFISGFIKGMNLIDPEGFLIKGIKSQGETDK